MSDCERQRVGVSKIPRWCRFWLGAGIAASLVLLAPDSLLLGVVLPESLALRGDLAESGIGQSPSTGERTATAWSFVGVREGKELRGKVVLPGRSNGEVLGCEGVIEPGVVYGRLFDEAGNVVGNFSGWWGVRGAEGKYELVSGEWGTWQWPAVGDREVAPVSAGN